MTGTGTELDPYIISNVTDLQAMENDLDAYYELGGNIDAIATLGWNGGDGFDPIGNYDGAHPEYAFTGGFDGKGYSITDLFIDRPTEQFVGLFGYADYIKWVKNVSLVSVNITGWADTGSLIGFNNFHGTGEVSNCSATGSVDANDGGQGAQSDSGGLMGYNGRPVSDCHFSGTLTTASYTLQEIGGLIGLNDGDLTRCYSTGQLNATIWSNIAFCTDSYDIGGLCGSNTSGEMSECFSSMNVTVTKQAGDDTHALYEIGGLCGYNWEIIDDCYAVGNVVVTSASTCTVQYVGGLVGYNRSLIDNVYSAGLVSVTGSTVLDVGGLIGKCEDVDLVTDSFWDTETSTQAASDQGTGKTTEQMKDETTFINAGWNLVITWSLNPLCNSGYPCLLNTTPLCAMPLSPRDTIPVSDIIALEAFRNIEMTAMGRGYIDEAGNFVYESRYARNP